VSRPSLWILGGIFFVVLGICVAGAVLAIAAGDEDVDINLGDDEFRLEDLDGAAARIAEDGPDIFPDLVGGNRPIMVNHVGDDLEEGWVAVLAIAPGTDACIVEWDAEEGVFQDCEGATYPPDGEGLTQFATTADVEGDVLLVDLGRGRPDDEEPEDPIVITGER
jgi:hypothetical protein